MMIEHLSLLSQYTMSQLSLPATSLLSLHVMSMMQMHLPLLVGHLNAIELDTEPTG